MKMNAAIVSIIALAAIVAAAMGAYAAFSDHGSDAEPDRYAILGAYEEEIEYLKERMDLERTVTISSIDYHVGTLSGKHVVIAKCGEGKVNAAMFAQTAISVFNAKAIINTGVAGTLSEEVGIGNIVISTDVVQHDYDMSPLGYRPGEVPNVGEVYLEADPELREAAALGIAKSSVGYKVFQGRICTGDQFVVGKEMMESITSRFGGLCCEMEGGAIAQVCYLSDVPFVIIRAISDDVDGGGPADFDRFMHEMAELSARMVLEMLKELRFREKSLEVMRGVSPRFCNLFR